MLTSLYRISLSQASVGLQQWRRALQRRVHRRPKRPLTSPGRGLLPPSDSGWPRDDTFRSALLSGLARLDMARFTLRHPQLVDTLLANILSSLGRYEQGLVDLAGEGQERGDSASSAGAGAGDNQGGLGERAADTDSGEGHSGREGAHAQEAAGDGDASRAALDRAEAAVASAALGLQKAAAAARRLEVEAVTALAADIVDKLTAEWQPLTEQLELAGSVFPDFDLADLGDAQQQQGEGRYGGGHGTWHASGWRELARCAARPESVRRLTPGRRTLFLQPAGQAGQAALSARAGAQPGAVVWP